MTDPIRLRQGVLEALAVERSTALSRASASGLKMAFNSLVGPDLQIDTAGAGVWTIRLEDRLPTSQVRAAVSANLARAVAAISREFVSFGREDELKLRNLDYQRAPIFDDFSRGNVLQFRPQADSEFHGVSYDQSLAARAMDRITNLLPSSADDSLAVETVFGARLPSRRAVWEVAKAARRASGLTLEYGTPTGETVRSVVTPAQAKDLRDVLAEDRPTVNIRHISGVLDGARSARRQFFLTTDNDEDIAGVIDEDLVSAVFANLRKRVRVTVEETLHSNMAGHVGRPAYRLTDISPLAEINPLFQ
jgi:hypothetical protein